MENSGVTGIRTVFRNSKRPGQEARVMNDTKHTTTFDKISGGVLHNGMINVQKSVCKATGRRCVKKTLQRFALKAQTPIRKHSGAYLCPDTARKQVLVCTLCAPIVLLSSLC